MRLRALFLPLALAAAGCTAPAPQPDTNPSTTPIQDTGSTGGELADRDRPLDAGPREERGVDLPQIPAENLDLGNPAAGPELAHRARKFYLQGVKLLYDPPRVDSAMQEFNLSLQADPTFYKAHFKLGICFYHKGQYDYEIIQYKKCLAINPQYTPAQLNLGHAFLARDLLEDAARSYRKVLEQQPRNTIALYNLGLVEFDLRQWDNSFKHLQQFLDLEADGEMSRNAKRYLEEIKLRRTEPGS